MKLKYLYKQLKNGIKAAKNDTGSFETKLARFLEQSLPEAAISSAYCPSRDCRVPDKLRREGLLIC